VCVNELLDQVIKIIIIAAQKTVETFYSVYLWNPECSKMLKYNIIKKETLLRGNSCTTENRNVQHRFLSKRRNNKEA
jgi:hypothetical protein